MSDQLLHRLESLLEDFGSECAPRVEELAAKSSAGTLSEQERSEYERLIRLNDLLGRLRVQSAALWPQRAAS